MRITRKTKYLSTEQYLELFAKLIKDTSRGKRLQKNGKRIRQNTIDNYIYTQKHLQDFSRETGNELRLYLVNHLGKKEKELAKKYYSKFFTDFTDYLYFKKDFYDNYVGLIIKRLRAFFNYINSECGFSVGDQRVLCSG